MREFAGMNISYIERKAAVYATFAKIKMHPSAGCTKRPIGVKSANRYETGSMSVSFASLAGMTETHFTRRIRMVVIKAAV